MALDTGKTLEDEFREIFRQHDAAIGAANARINDTVDTGKELRDKTKYLELKVIQLEEEIRVRTWVTIFLLIVVTAVLATQIMLTQSDVRKLQNPTDTVESTKSVAP